jgi:hypothetical protein
MKVYVIVGENTLVNNISARAAYSRRRDAEDHLEDKKRMWFDERAVVIELELDEEVPERQTA